MKFNSASVLCRRLQGVQHQARGAVDGTVATPDVTDEHEDEESKEDDQGVEVVRQEGGTKTAHQRVGQASDDRHQEPAVI